MSTRSSNVVPIHRIVQYESFSRTLYIVGESNPACAVTLTSLLGDGLLDIAGSVACRKARPSLQDAVDLPADPNNVEACLPDYSFSWF